MASELKPFAHCCAEAGGDPADCDCVNKDHGTAVFHSVCSMPNCRNRAPADEAFCAKHRSDQVAERLTRPAPEYAGLVEREDYDIAAAATNHADKVLRAAGSALKHYTTPSIKKAILSAMMDAIEEAYRAGAVLVIARTSALTERNKALEAEVERLREAAAAVLHDWHSDTGFVESVRLTTGRPWPWYHGEKSVADLRTALGDRP